MQSIHKGQSLEETINNFCAAIDKELNTNKSFIITFSDDNKKKIIELDLIKINEYFSEHKIILRPKRIYKKRNKHPKPEKKSHKKLEQERLNKF